MVNGRHGPCGVSVVSHALMGRCFVTDLVETLSRSLEAETVRVRGKKRNRVPSHCVLFMVNGLYGHDGQNAIKAVRVV